LIFLIGTNIECTCISPYILDGQNCVLDCSIFDNCNGHGTCKIDNNRVPYCDCNENFSGQNCSSPKCPGIVECSSKGYCTTDLITNEPKCICNTNYTGADCSVLVCPGEVYDQGLLINCNNNGVCTDKIDGKNYPICECFPGYQGLNCSFFNGSEAHQCSDPTCSNHGVCNGTVCNCNKTWTGLNCGSRDCSMLKNCSEPRGRCIGENDTYSYCDCIQEGITGEACDEPIMDIEGQFCYKNCSNNGKCNTVGKIYCECATGFKSPDCSERIDINSKPPSEDVPWVWLVIGVVGIIAIVLIIFGILLLDPDRRRAMFYPSRRKFIKQKIDKVPL